ncbi:hypothetical protein L226DRAFT_536776 [Lentinus tigrinus ALCF2SS1-7]|nr:hypothetical protein L226DRAFT_536776 [Lentinus tigrinus ALCF2SS1-7]
MSGEKFTITAPPSTDIWRKPPSTDSFNAPTHALLPNAIPLRSFLRARLTFSASWTTRYDQGGLLLHLKHPEQPTDRWLKTGVEFYQGRVFLSTVATQTYSDWSIAPPADVNNPKVTIEVRREGDELGTSLWVYEVVQGPGGEVERRPLREVTWFFGDEEGWEVEVSAMAARPAKKESVVGGSEGLVVKFEGVEVDVV